MTAHEESMENWKEQTLRLWGQKLSTMFPEGVPDDYVWTEKADLIRVLTEIGEENLNHVFFPGGGGMDLTGASDSFEPGCIELHFGSRADIVKPERLVFHSFGPTLDWSYFRLETQPLAPIGVSEPADQRYEEVLETAPGHYVDSAVLYAGASQESESGSAQPLPETARRVIRHFKGSFVIFPKGSRYTSVPGAYGGRHDKTDDAQFNAHVRNAVEQSSRRRRR